MDLRSVNYFLPLYAVAKTIGSSAAEKLPLIASANTCICEKAVGLEHWRSMVFSALSRKFAACFPAAKTPEAVLTLLILSLQNGPYFYSCKSKVVAAKYMFAIAKYVPLQLQTVILQQ